MLRFAEMVTLASLVFELSAAHRIEVVAKFGEQRVTGVRACFSRAAADGGVGSGVIERLVSGPETRCLPAEKVLNIPAGSWHMYLVSDDPFLVSMHPTVFHRNTGSTDEDDIARVTVDLVPAATVNLEVAASTLREGESLALYVTHAGSQVSPPALVPVPPGAREMAIPARTPVIPLVLHGTEIVRVGESTTIDIGGRVAALFRERTEAVVVVPFRFPSETDAADLPSILFQHRRLGRTLSRYHPTATEGRGLIFVENVERGKANVLLDGVGFTAKSLEFVVSPSMAGHVVATEDLVISRAEAGFAISWAIDEQFATDVRASTRCVNAPAAVPAPPMLRLYSCASGKKVSRPRHLDNCVVLRETMLSFTGPKEINWPGPTGLSEGVVELSYGGISAFEQVTFNGAKSSYAGIRLAPAFITGHITERKEPAAAEVGCGGPVQTTDPSGYYRCWRAPGAPPFVYLNLCDGSGTYQQAFNEDATVVDVDVATNTLRVHVVDALSGEPVEGAYVSLWEASPSQIPPHAPEPESTLLGPTNNKGEVSTSRLQPREIAICAQKKEFPRVCRENVFVERDADAQVELTLRRESVVRGRINSATEIVNGNLYVMAGAVQIAEASVERDATFLLASQPPPEALFILASESIPLCVLRPTGSAEGILLNVPALRPRSFVVSSRTLHTRLTLELGSVLLSTYAFSRHQILRHEQYVVSPGHPVRVDAVDSALGVTVVVGDVALVDAPPSNPASLPRYPVGDRSMIELP
jgi:hypothetical protein